MKGFVDADFVVYKNCASAEYDVDYGDDVIIVQSKFKDAYKNVTRDLDRIKHNISDGFDEVELVLFFSDSVNFRKKIFPDYKGHRNRKKPCGYKRVISKLMDEYQVVILPTLEADDALGINATMYPGNVVISPDKDLRQIPGMLFNLEEMMSVEPEEGRRWHLIQSLAGDQTDGYAGAPGFGVKTATKLFEEKGYNWETVVEAFKSKGLDEEVALRNARLAKILTKEEYDYGKLSIKLWDPSNATTGTDNGAGP
jgi:DNA polymerase-1